MRNNPSSGKGRDGDKKGFEKRGTGKPAGGFKKPAGRDKRDDEAGPKRSFDRDDRSKRSFSKDGADRPKRSFPKDGEDRPKRSFSRDGDDRPKRSFSRDGEDKPKRSFDKPFNKDRKFDNDRPKRSFDKDGDRPKRSFSKDGEDRPKRSFSKDGEDRPKRSFSRDGEDKPKRSSFERSPYNKDRKFDSDRPKRSFDKDGDRPKRSFSKDGEDRPKRSFSKDGEDRPKRSFSRDGDDKPKRSYDKDKKGFDKDGKGGKFDKKDNRPESKKKFSERNIFKEDKPARPVEDYEKNFVTPKEFEKTLGEGKKLTIKKGERAEDFDKPFPLGSRKVSGPFRKNEAENYEKAKQEYFAKKDEVKKKRFRKEDDEKEEESEIKEMTLNKYIAHSGTCSRREAAEMVKKGKVKVNGELALDPGYRVQEFDEVTIAGKKLTPQRNRVYLLLNKPKGFITTTDDPQGRDTVMDLVAGAEVDRLYPVGRLDRNTTGLLLLTNDGDLAQKLSHPSYETKKVYQVTLDKALTKKDFEAILAGLELEDGPVVVDALSYLDEKTELGIEIHSGRNRIVRRIFESLGYTVEKLDRVMYAGLTKKNLPRGEWRLLDEKEVILLKHFKI